MGKNKIAHFEDNARFRHVIEPDFDVAKSGKSEWQGKWAEFFGSDNPITVELGCGKGEHTAGMAKMYLGIWKR